MSPGLQETRVGHCCFLLLRVEPMFDVHTSPVRVGPFIHLQLLQDKLKTKQNTVYSGLRKYSYPLNFSTLPHITTINEHVFYWDFI